MAEKRPDPSITFSQIGGLREQIQAVKEMVLFPILYKEVLEQHKMKPPRGVLFHGPPGTGKTLVASALANECSRGDIKVTFISRKGADILGSFVGESEMRLRQVFERARLFSPSIIFFDELDALAPARDSLARSNHVHASVVSVLLTEMDGVGSAGNDVYVIGATNRLDAVDPALRRAGRFDRELRFTLPTCEERVEILRVHTSAWPAPVAAAQLAQLAAITHGHCGSDLQAICAEAVLCSLRRLNPGLGDCAPKQRISLPRLKVLPEDFAQARSKFVPAAHRSTSACARCLPTMMEPIFRETVDTVVAGLRERFPYGYLHRGKETSQTDYRPPNVPRVLLTGPPDHGHTCHLAPAILHHFEHLPVVTIDIAALFCKGSFYTDVACIKAMQLARNSLPAVLYLPDLTCWWSLVNDATRLVFSSLLAGLPVDTPLLVVATSHHPHAEMPAQLQDLFAEGCDVVALSLPNAAQREKFFAPLMLGEPSSGASDGAPDGASDDTPDGAPDNTPDSPPDNIVIPNIDKNNGRNDRKNGRKRSSSVWSGDRVTPAPWCRARPGRKRKTVTSPTSRNRVNSLIREVNSPVCEVNCLDREGKSKERGGRKKERGGKRKDGGRKRSGQGVKCRYREVESPEREVKSPGRGVKSSGGRSKESLHQRLGPPPKKKGRGSSASASASASAKMSRSRLADAAHADARKALLARLVAATSGFPSRPLERAYGELSSCFARWASHQDRQQLLTELGDRVSAVEQDAAERAQSVNDDDSDMPSYLY